MSAPKINLNKSALVLFQKMCDQADKYSVTVEQTESGATIVDAGLKAE
ncbi:MAG: methenyltetrahydromethanopterin cyclohydrolase, partial [Betaproteobacteria bacterium]